jgi:hypothetical protein
MKIFLKFRLNVYKTHWVIFFECEGAKIDFKNWIAKELK